MPALSSEARAIALLALAAFVSASAFRICDPMLPQLAAEFGASTGQAARAVTAFAVAYGVLQMFFGPVGDRYGKYRVVSVATFACALGSAGAFAAETLDALVLCRALSGAAGAGIVPLSMAWIGDTVPYERRQATLARFLTGTILGMAAGQLAGGLFADTLGWRWAFAALVGGYLVVGALLHREVRRQRALGLGVVDPNAPRQGFVAQARLVLGTPWARVVLATVFIEGLLVFGALAFAPSYLHERFDISLTAAGALVAVYAVGGLLYTVVAGRILKRLGERGLAVAGGLVLGVAFL
ncbi:MFS transporter, partial [Achromobacter insuavis]